MTREDTIAKCLEDRIAECLEEHHCGERNVVPSRELESAFLVRGPDLRNIINNLRGKGIPICSSSKGYFFAETEEELDRTSRQLLSRIKKIAHAERGLNKAKLVHFPDHAQISLPFEGGDSG